MSAEMNQVQKFLLKLFRGIGTSRSKRLATLVERGEYALLQQERMSPPSNYQNAQMYLRDALCVEIMRKCLLPGEREARRNKAVETFWASEAQCATTNARLAPFLSGGPFQPGDEGVAQFISVWRKEVSRVLGKLPLRLEPRFSSGSTLSDKGKLTTIPDKMSSAPTVYAGSTLEHYHTFQYTILDGKPIQRVRANKFFTVPKDSEKDRGCAIEASSNVAMQLAVGAAIKARYKTAYGVDLGEAQDTHRRLSREASIQGHLATIDLSNASDTVSRKLVKLLLPPAWFTLLNSLRAPLTEIDGRTVWLEKFSSMGNGFTFELETLIFMSMMVALGCTSCAAYGDDMIVETEKSSAVIAALKFFGFTPNIKKTFVEGPFRESCGGDYFNGVPVRAHYLKELPDEPQKWIELANGLRRVDPSGRFTAAAWWFCVDQVPTDWRNFGPASLVGVSVFHSEDAKPVLKKYRNEDVLVPSYRVKRPVTQAFDLGSYWAPEVALAAAALGVGSRVTPRESVTGYRTSYIPAYGIGSTDVRRVGNYLLVS